MEDVLKVNVADLDTVTGSDFFPPLSSNIDIFRGVAEIETSSGRIRTAGEAPGVVQSVRQIIQTGN